jgi:hypothetical protein
LPAKNDELPPALNKRGIGHFGNKPANKLLPFMKEACLPPLQAFNTLARFPQGPTI